MAFILCVNEWLHTNSYVNRTSLVWSKAPRVKTLVEETWGNSIRTGTEAREGHNETNFTTVLVKP